MWQLAMLALATAASTPDKGLVIEGVEFGPRLTLTCSWFSNFENSRFNRCEGRAGSVLSGDEPASIQCQPPSCEQLDAQARKAADWRKPEPPWGTFTVRLIGRVGLQPHPKRYIGDGTRTVLIEKVLSVQKSE